VAAGLLLVALLAGCTSTVPGSGRAAGPEPPPGAAATGAPPAGRAALAADVLPDECLLDAVEFSALLGEAVLPPEQGEVVRADGSRPSSCFANSAGPFPTPLAMVNVYEPREGTPAEFVRAAPAQGRRDLPGVGEAAVLIDTTPGVTLQLAAARYVVTIAVLDGSPDDAAWTTAATAALAALGG
jgi:hypothetical protein